MLKEEVVKAGLGGKRIHLLVPDEPRRYPYNHELSCAKLDQNRYWIELTVPQGECGFGFVHGMPLYKERPENLIWHVNKT